MLKSKRLFLILLMLAPVMLTVFINRPIGFAELTGIPNDTIIGTRIIAEPIPPNEKTNDATKAIEKIIISTDFNYSVEQEFSSIVLSKKSEKRSFAFSQFSELMQYLILGGLNSPWIKPAFFNSFKCCDIVD